MKKVAIILVVIFLLLFVCFTLGRRLLAWYEMSLVEKARRDTPQIQFNELKNDFETVVKVINEQVNKEEYNTFYIVYDEKIGIFSLTAYIDDKQSDIFQTSSTPFTNYLARDYVLKLNDDEIKSFKKIRFSGNEDVLHDLYNISIENSKIRFSNEYGYNIYYIHDDNESTSDELEKERNKNDPHYWSVIKLDEHWYQITNGI